MSAPGSIWATIAALAVFTYSAVPVGIAAERHRSAHVARTFSLNETGRLHLTSHHGFTHNEQGFATGHDLASRLGGFVPRPRSLPHWPYSRCSR